MNELLQYLSEISKEIYALCEDIDCDALELERSKLSSIQRELRQKIDYYQGFNTKEDKKSVRYFMSEMTQQEFEFFIKNSQVIVGKRLINFNKINYDLYTKSEDLNKI